MANNSKLVKTIGTLAAVSFSLGAFADADAGDVFEAEELNAGFMSNQTNFGEGSCGEGSCGEGSCGEEDDDNDDKDEEGACGEGACGEGACGEGACGEA